jgi:serine/threonine protein kinase/tetratricopeptide (TPR) repeat protein
MALVFLAEDLKHRRRVAVKVLRPELAAALGPERFLREIHTTAGLQHPNILTLIDSGDAAGQLYYVMPYVEGESLRARISREGPLPLAEAVALVRAVAPALDFAHRQGIVHRDLKPENILLHQGVPMVADFGIALPVAGDGVDRLTDTGVSLGTAAYMSPEQVAGTAALDGRSDQYSLACLFYELVSGAPPFTAPTARGVFVKQVTDLPSPLRGAREATPQNVVQAVTRALEKDPANRFATIAEFAAALGNPGAPPIPDRSIVVLPFTNLSPDPDNEYFGDGLTEELIADLSKVRELRVIARNSSMRLKGTTKDAPTLGRELRVRYVLGGSVRRAGNDLRITAQLSDAHDDSQVWAEKYAGGFDRVFDLQERLSRQIVAALRMTLTPDEGQALAARPIKSPDVYDRYVRARHEMRKATKPANDAALALLREADAIEGDNPFLTATLGWLFCTYPFWGFETDFDPLEQADRCLAAAQRAGPGHPQVEFLAAGIEFVRGGYLASAQRARNILEQVPTHLDALQILLAALPELGEIELNMGAIARFRDLDPLSTLTHHMAGRSELLANRFDDAIASCQRSLALEPGNQDARAFLAWATALIGRRTEARAMFLEIIDEIAAWSEAIPAVYRMYSAGLAGDPEGVVKAVTPTLTAYFATTDPLFTHMAAQAHAMAGLRDQAVDWLDRAIAMGFINYPFIVADPLLANLRGFPRFEASLPGLKAKWEAAALELSKLPRL